jgi:hypothetical protein
VEEEEEREVIVSLVEKAVFVVTGELTLYKRYQGQKGLESESVYASVRR